MSRMYKAIQLVGVLILIAAFGVALGNQLPDVPARSWPAFDQFLARLQKVQPAPDAVSHPLPWTADMVRSVATLFNVQERAEKVLAKWQESGSVEWVARDGQSYQMSLGLIRFSDAAAARAYIGLAIDLQRKQDELLGARLVDSQSASAAIAGADEAIRTQKSIRAPGNPNLPPIVVNGLLIRSGELVLEFTRQGKPVSPNWGERIFATLLVEPVGR